MAKMGAAILVCIVVLALDVTAGILGIEAQAAQNKVMFQDIGIFFTQITGILKMYDFASSCTVGILA